MEKLSKIYKILGIAFSFPIKIQDSNGNLTYCEYSDGYWSKWEYDARDNCAYYEDSDGFWSRSEYDSEDNETYYEDSYGDKKGTPRSQSCDGKVIEVDGKKYQLKQL